MTTHLQTFSLVGRKESIADYITLIAPSDTPFQTAVKSEAVHNTLYQWMEDQLRAVALNARIEGADPVNSLRDQPQMRSNGTQILEETFRVSGTAEAVKTYGRDKIAAREMMKTGKLLKMDLEFSMVGNAQAYIAATGVVAGTFASYQAQIAPATTITVTGPLTEVALVNLHENLYNAGSDATTLMVKPSDTRIIASWGVASGRTVQMDNGDKSITNVINIYESPFGTVRVVKNRRQRASDALLFDPKNWKICTLRNWFRENLAKTGDSDRYMMVGEFGLKHAHRAASAILLALT